MVVVEILLALAGLLIAVNVIRRGSITSDLSLLLSVGVVFGYPFFNIDLGPLPLTLPRLLIGVMGLRWLTLFLQGKSLPLRAGITEVGLLGFLGYLAIQLSLTDWQFNELKPLSHFLFFILLPSVVYLLVSHTEISTLSLTRFRLAMSAFGAYLAIMAILETLGPQALVFPSYITSPEHTEYLGRARGPFLNPTPNAIALTMAMLCGASFWPSASRSLRVVIISYVGLILAGVFLTYTRSCWMGAALGLGWLTLWNLTPRVRVAILVAGVVLGLPLMLEITERASSFKRDKHVTAEEMAKSASLRPLLAQVAFEIFKDRPWTGVGYGQYVAHNQHYIDVAMTDEPLQRVLPYVQHNTFLAILAETGLIGTSLLALFSLGSLALGLWTAFQYELDWERRSIAWIFVGTLAAWAFNAMWHDVLIDGNGLPMWTGLAGLTASVARQFHAAQSTALPVQRDEALAPAAVRTYSPALPA